MLSVIRLIGIIVKNIVFYFVRFIYSCWNILRMGIPPESKIAFPLMIRGKHQPAILGRFDFGKNIYIRTDGKCSIGSNFVFGEHSQLIIDEGGSFSVGQNFHVESNCILRTRREMIVGKNVFIASGTKMFSRENGHYGNVTIGDNCNFANDCLIDSSEDISIGNNVALGANCTIYTHNHDYKKGKYPVWKGNVIGGGITISDGAWIGANVTILAGVKIGYSAIIGAGSVVTKNVPDYSIFVGNPAKGIGVLPNTIKAEV